MPDATGPVTEAVYIDAPRDARLKALYDYWNHLRGERKMPARADFDPTAIPALLPYVIMYGVVDGAYTVRLVGEEIVQFAGQNATGGVAGQTMPPRSAQALTAVLDAVTRERAPKFRAGTAHWNLQKTYRAFEACYLPLSPDGENVNFLLGGVCFPETTG
jgi:hypothetical protein